MGWGVTGNRFRVLGAIPRYSYRCLPTIYHNSDHLVIYSFIHPINTYSAPTMWHGVDNDLVYHGPYSPQAYNQGRDDKC